MQINQGASFATFARMDALQTSVQATAGFLNTDWNPRDVPAGTVTTNVVLRTADAAATSGSLYSPATPSDTVVCVMHPREFMACHYLIPDIVGAGYAAWSQSPRSVGNDLRLEHEFALHDVATGLAYLKSRGFRRIVLLGNSGGAGPLRLLRAAVGAAAGGARRQDTRRPADAACRAGDAARRWLRARGAASRPRRAADELHRSIGERRRRRDVGG